MATSQVYLEQLRRSFAIAKKDIRVYYSKGPVVISGILFPASLFLAFCMGRHMSMSFLIPGLLAITLLFTATAVSPVVAPWETMMRTLERLVSCPVVVSTIIFGDMLASSIFGVAISIVPILVGLVAGVNMLHPFILALGIILSASCFSSLGLIFSSPPTSMPATIQMLSSIVKFSLVFISGIFIPLDELPAWGKGIASISPLTYFTDLARYCVQGNSQYPVFIDLVVILAFTVLFLVVAIKLHERNLPKRF